MREGRRPSAHGKATRSAHPLATLTITAWQSGPPQSNAARPVGASLSSPAQNVRTSSAKGTGSGSAW